MCVSHQSVFLQAGCPSCRPTNSVKALTVNDEITNKMTRVSEAHLAEETLHQNTGKQSEHISQPQPIAQRHTHTHTRVTALCLGQPRSAGTRKVKPIWILLKQETVSDSGISWAICKSAPRSRQITTPAPHYSVFYSPDALPASQPTASKH